MLKGKVSKIIRRIIVGLPLLGAAIANLLPISARAHQFLIGMVLIWFQVFLLSEVFYPGNNV